ncbi:hypothetical protein ACOME3_007025 [Neoechinorhynchus agilis]
MIISHCSQQQTKRRPDLTCHGDNFVVMEPMEPTFAEALLSIDEELHFQINVDMGIDMASCSTACHLALLPSEVCRMHFSELVKTENIFKCFYWFHKVLREGSWTEFLTFNNSPFRSYEMTGFLARKPNGEYLIYAVGQRRDEYNSDSDSLTDMRWDLTFNTQSLPTAFTQFRFDCVDLRNIRVIPHHISSKYIKVNEFDGQCIQSVRQITRRAMSKDNPDQLSTMLRNLLEINVQSNDVDNSSLNQSDATFAELFGEITTVDDVHEHRSNNHPFDEEHDDQLTKRPKLHLTHLNDNLEDKIQKHGLSPCTDADFFGFDHSLL